MTYGTYHAPSVNETRAHSLSLLLVTGRFPQLSETFIYRKAVALARIGHRVTVLARDHGDWAQYPEPLPAGLRVEIAPPDGALRDPRRAIASVAGTLRITSRSPAAARRLYDRCKQDPRTRHDPVRHFVRHLPFLGRHADVIHFEFLGSGTMYPLAGELTKAPVVVSCRGSDVHMLELQPEPIREAQLECLRTADALHCVSDEIARQVERMTGRRNGVWVNRPAVATDQITPRTWTIPDARPLRILATGRLTWKKGFDYLLASLARVAAAGIAFEAEILGDGELLPSLRFGVEDAGLTDRVRFVGAVAPAEVLSRLQSVDVFVLPSLDEGISNAVLEAMASGVPVITTNVGGMAEAVRDGVDGFVVPVRDIDAMAARLLELARDRGMIARMGLSARERAVAEFSLARQVAAFDEIYASVRR